MKSILITGAFGNVGANALEHLTKQQYTTYAFDVRNERNEKLAAKLGKTLNFTTIWGNLRDPASVKAAFEQAKPDAVLHIAAVIAPTAYIIPDVAHDVNVNGTRYLLDAAREISAETQFIFTSSYSVHGCRNPYKNLPPLTGDTPVNPGDNYGKHKVEGEAMVRASGLPWTIIRLPAVMPTSADFGASPEFLKFTFLLPLERHEHVIDSRDAGLALVNAIGNAQAIGRTFDIGGPESDCRLTGAELMGKSGEARGLSMPASAFRVAHPDVDESWYFDDWVDTSESQRVLQYQEHTFADYLQYIRKQAGWKRHLLKLAEPLVIGRIVKDSPYYGKPATPDPTPTVEVIRNAFGLSADQF